MTTKEPVPEAANAVTADPDEQARAAAYRAVHDDPDFVALKSRFRRFVFPVTIAFLVWYLLYVLLANYAHGFMATRLGGSHINVALIFGLLQFVSTFVIAYLYSRKARRDFDPLASRLKDKFDRTSAGTEKKG